MNLIKALMEEDLCKVDTPKFGIKVPRWEYADGESLSVLYKRTSNPPLIVESVIIQRSGNEFQTITFQDGKCIDISSSFSTLGITEELKNTLEEKILQKIKTVFGN